MSTPTPLLDKPADLTASDILSPNAWNGRTATPVVGLDVACTKIAVDFQNMRRESVDECMKRNLELLREVTASDCVFTAAINPEDLTLKDIEVASSAFSQCRPQALEGESLESYPWLKSHLDHLRLSELRDTSAPRREQSVEAARLAALGIGSVLIVAFRLQDKPAGLLGLAHSLPRGAWDVNLQLMMKLIGTSLATGLDRMRIESRLAKLEERTTLAQSAANDGLWDFDVESNEVYFSPRWKAMLGYADEDMQGSPDWRSLVHPDDLSRVQAAIRHHVAGKTPTFESTRRMRHKSGEWRWVVSRAKARVDKHGRLLRLVGVEFDITERKIYEEALFREKESAQITLQSIGDGVITTDAQSTIDYINPVAEELTGWRLEDAMGRPVEGIFRAFHEETCEPLENPLSVSIRRIRPIKSVRPMLLIRRDGNELYVESTAAPIRVGSGHGAGGVLVFHDVSESRELNRRLSYHASHDLLTGLVNRREFESRMERALKSAKAREASYALCYLDIEDVASILSAADSACAAAKEGGRNRVHSFAENDIELMRRRREMQWAARINAALEEGRFELFRMPILPLQVPETGAHYELLLRMRDENGRIVAPDSFIAAAERYGIIPSIDRWVVENALRWLVSEADERERLSMCSINLSGQSLGDDKFLPFVIDQFHRSGLDASKICFEITETAAVASFSQANRFIQALKELGCKFALDDFGTGLSSFGYLKHFPVDYLKIDGSFVREILHDPIDREMVRSINEIGHLTGKQTIAEFAENAEIIQMLRNIGVDFAQGYGVAQPQRILKSVSSN